MPAAAHPVPFTYLDIRFRRAALDVSLVAHVVDLANDLQDHPGEHLLEPAVVAPRAAIRSLLTPRLTIAADGRALTPHGRRRPRSSPSGNRCGSRSATRWRAARHR